MKRLLLAALLALPNAVHAQIGDGLETGSFISVMNTGYATYFSQSFIAKGTQLSRLDFWYTGGTYTNPSVEDQYASLRLWEGVRSDPFNDRLFETRLDQNHSGRFTWTFDTPLTMVLGASYTLSFFVNNCGPVSMGACGAYGKVPGDVNRDPSTFLTTPGEGDQYPDGFFFYAMPENDTGQDMRFYVEYVPEPSSLALLLGAVPLALIAGYRRRGARS